MFLEKINKYLKESDQSSEHIVGEYWPSQASIKTKNNKVIGKCLRELYYSIKGVPKTNPTPITIKRKQLYGKKIEEAEIELLKKTDQYIDSNVDFKFNFRHITISGKIDAIGKINDDIRGIEYKSGSGYLFKKEIFGDSTNGSYPKLVNLFQTMLYLDAFKIHEKYQLNEFCIYYVDRENCNTKEFIVKLDAGFPVVDNEINYNFNIVDIYNRYIILDSYIKNNQLPPCDYYNYIPLSKVYDMFSKKEIGEYKYNSWIKMGYGIDFNCQYCNWLDQCRSQSSIGNL